MGTRIGPPAQGAVNRNLASCGLDCGHTLQFQRTHLPTLGELLWCVKCDRVASAVWVAGVHVARCADCKWAWSSKAAPLSTLTRGTAHALKRMHRVNVTRGEELVETIDPTQGQETLPGGVDVPPF